MAERIIIGMSGGVDSSVAALCLQEQGYDVHGLFMKNWEEDDRTGYCSAAEDLRDAQAVCERLHIPLHTVNFATEYWDLVFTHFLREYQAGRTPNPDVLCNREIKFKVFLEYAMQLGAHRIATGHYARILPVGDEFLLLKGLDENKDQSYFLYTIEQSQLAVSHFPIGHLTKKSVREWARQAQLPTQAKKDSTGLCFIGERPFRTFLSRFLAPNPGPIETAEGRYLGQHQGLMFYTLGQRQGLTIGGCAWGNGQPWYVAKKDQSRNCLIVVQGHQHPLLFSQHVQASHVHWINSPPPLPYICEAKTRYRQPQQTCAITELTPEMCHVTFIHPQWAVTPGQSIVFYRAEQCLGGAIIETSH